MTLSDILELFGTPEAKERFLRPCREYYGDPVNSRRADIHAEIMQVIQKLYQRRQWGSLEKRSKCVNFFPMVGPIPATLTLSSLTMIWQIPLERFDEAGMYTSTSAA